MRIQGSGFRVQGSGCRVQGAGFRVQGSGLRVHQPEEARGRPVNELAMCLPRQVMCEDRIGTGPPRARTEVIYADLGYWAISGSIHPKGDPASWGINSSMFRS